jgi:Spy/CpxP family protein refolding chaperone
MRGVDLAIYADALAGEAASLSARAERARSRLRQAAIEKRARGELTRVAIERLEALGLLGAIDEAAARSELRELEAALDALEELQSWIENQLVELSPRSATTSEATS